MYSGGSSDGEGKMTPPPSSMPWVRNLRRFIGSGAGLGSEALMGKPRNVFFFFANFLLNSSSFGEWDSL